MRKTLKYLITSLVGLCVITSVQAQEKEESSFDMVKGTVSNFWEKSNWEAVGSIGSYHDRGYYSKKSIDCFNERNVGFGLGLVYTSDEKNEHSVKFLRISDSRYNPQNILTYQYMYNVFKTDVDLQLGAMAGLTTRVSEKSDKTLLIPFVLPAAGIKLWNLKFNVTYLPRMKMDGSKYGGFTYVWGTYEFK